MIIEIDAFSYRDAALSRGPVWAKTRRGSPVRSQHRYIVVF